MSQSVWTVTNLIRFIKKRLEAESSIQSVSVQGEISNFVAHRSGHWYFTLKDAQSRCSCVMFARSVSSVKIRPKDGDQVVVVGSISVFEGSGSMQLYVSQMMPTGLGALYIELEKIKQRCIEKGYFDPSHKKKLPMYPKNIGLITSVDTAAYHDVVSTLARRWPMASIKHFPSAVQGEGSVDQLIQAVKIADQSSLDVILLVRGGGSIEDLWSFNSELLVETLFLAKTPIISGVGHQSDITLVDFVSDVRAPTPTGAAELAAPNQQDISEQLSKYRSLMEYQMKMMLNQSMLRFDQIAGHPLFVQKDYLVSKRQQQISVIRASMMKKASEYKQMSHQLSIIRQSIQHNAQNLIGKKRLLLNREESNLLSSIKQFQIKNSFELTMSRRVLMSLSPNEILKRGYTLTYQDSVLITRMALLQTDRPLKITYHDGSAIATQIVKGDDYGTDDI